LTAATKYIETDANIQAKLVNIVCAFWMGARFIAVLNRRSKTLDAVVHFG
jgi:hypothetical protein